MANQVTFSEAQIEELRQKLVDVAGIADTVAGKFKPVYDLVNPWIQASGANSQTKLFFRLAVEVNNDADTPANKYIRRITKLGLQLPRAGDDRDTNIQRTSSAIARRIFEQIRDGSGVPSLNDIIKNDVRTAIDDGTQTWGGWGGSIFFLDERVGNNDESLAKLIFQDDLEVKKFQIVTIEASKEVIQRYGVATDFGDAFAQAFKADFIAVLTLLVPELSPLQATNAAGTLIGIATVVSIYAAAGSITRFYEEMRRLLPLDQLPSRIAFTTTPNDKLLVTVPDIVDVQTIAQANDLMGSLASLLGKSIVVETSNHSIQAIFGSDGSNRLIATGATDALFGNAGFDSYEIGVGGGLDTVSDSDGAGEIIRGGKKLALGVKQSDSEWSLRGVTYTKTSSGLDLDVTFTGSPGDKITIKNFDFAMASQDYLGIKLVAAPSAPVNPVREFLGDKQDWDSDPGQDGVQVQNDGFGNAVRADGQGGRPDLAQADRAEVFYGSGADEVERFTTGGGNDAVYGDGSNSATSTTGGRDLVETGAGRDVVAAGGGKDWVEGGSEADILTGNVGNDVLYAGTSNNQTLTLDQAISAGETATSDAGTGEIVSGDAGDDFVYGANTADLLLGGAGEDVIVGGGGNDTIYGDTGLTSAALDWTLTRTRTDSAGAATFNVATTNAVFSADAATGGLDVIYGGAGDDWIFAGAGDDSVEGGAGDDVILGEAGNDALLGGDGNDFIDGDSTSTPTALQGDDFLDGGAGDDTLLGAGGNDILYGGAGDDILVGGNGNDTLYGGVGMDILVGGAGKDTYVFNRGDGTEVIQDTPSGADDPEASVLVLGPGISKDDIKFRKASLLVDMGGGDAIHFNGFDDDDPASTPVLGSIQFADGSSMTYQDILDRGFDIDGTEGDDTLEGTGVTDRIDGKGGNDTLIGKRGDDTLHGGAGDDVLAGDFGDDAVYGDAGDDVLDGGDGNDALFGGAGEDRLVGGIGDDTLNGGTGADTLTGEAGSDVYSFAPGDGEDTIDEQGLIAIGVGDDGTDVVRFAAGVDASSVALTHEANGDLTIDYGPGDKIAVQGQFTTVGNGIERIEFNDGTVIDQAAINALPVAPIMGTAGDDTLIGTVRNDTIRGLGGDDSLDGGEGGDDLLEGGAGADAYAVYIGMGKDVIADASANGETSTLQLAAGLSPASFKAEQRGNNLYLALRGTQYAVTIRDYYDQGAPAQSWQLRESDGTLTALADALALPDPSADVAAHQAMRSYEQSVLAGWTALSRPAQLPTSAFVFMSWSQTTTHIPNQLFPNMPGTTFVEPPVLYSSIQGYGRRVGGYFEGVNLLGRVITPTVYAQASDQAQIDPLGSVGVTSTHESHAVHYTEFVPTENFAKSSTVSSGGASNTTVSTSSSQWLNIRLDGNGPVRANIGVRTDSIQAAVEEITAGDGDNSILGVFDPYHVALIDAGGGNDTVTAGFLDFVYGGDGDDRVTGGIVVLGGNGDDTLTQGRSLYGGAGDDTLSGGAFLAGGDGNDVLSGQDGVNVYSFGAGDQGVDAVSDSGGIERAAFEEWYYQQLGIPMPDESRYLGGRWGAIGNSGEVLTYNFRHGGATLGMPDFYYGDGHFSGGEWPSMVYQSIGDLGGELARLGRPYRAEDIRYIQPLPPAPDVRANDYALLQPLYDAGLVEQDTVDFGAGIALGNLTLVREQQSTADGPVDKTLVITWGEGKSVRVALAQAEDLIGTGIERYRFADGTVKMTKDLLALATPVLLHDSSEEFVFAPGQGSVDLGPSFRFVLFDPAISRPEIAVGRNGTDLVISRTGSGDSLRIAGWYADPSAIPPVTATFLNGGATLSTSELTDAGLQLHGTPGDDQLEGVNGFDNVIYGEGGNDFMTGGTGNDTYVYTPGGRAEISDTGGTDTLRLSAGIAPADVMVTRDAGNLYLNVSGPQNRVQLDHWFDAGRIESVEFADGMVWDAAELEARIVTARATGGDDVIFGSPGDDTIDALGGNDQVIDEAGSDLLAGGAGDDDLEALGGGDLLQGGDGNDFLYEEGRSFVAGGAGDDFVSNFGDGAVIAFNPGDGHDTIQVHGGLTLSIGGDVGVADLSLARDGDDLVLSVGSSDSIRLTRAGEADPQAWPQITLQLFGSVHNYDLTASIDGAIADHHIGDSQTEALGGALAWQYATTGSLNALSTSQQRSVLADANFGAAAQPISLAPPVNHAPVVSAADSVVVLNDVVAASSLFSVTDSDNDTIAQYEFWDSTAGNGHFTVNGVETGVNVAIPVFAAELANTAFAASGTIGNDLVWVRANDGQAWSDWKSWTVYSSPHLTNALPVVSAGDASLLLNDSALASTLFAATDADNDPITQYEFWDDVAGGGYFRVNGIFQGNNPIPVAAADLAQTEYVAGGDPGTERVWVRASDGIGWGAWQAWNMTSALHMPNAAPEVTAGNATLLLGDSIAAASLFSVTDADNDPITQYEFWDSTAGNGHFAVNGVEQGVNVAIPVSSSSLQDTFFVGGSATGSDLLWVRASDGQVWGDWKSWTVNSWPHLGNQAPVVSAADATLLTSQVVAAADLFSVTDGDGDSMTKYEFWDDVAGGGYFRVNGVQQGAAQSIPVSAADLTNTEYVGGASGGTERVWVRANDGLEWSAWQPWNITTALHVPNAAPVVAASDATVLLGDTVAASSLFSVTDADNDPITQYEFWDSTGGNGHFAVNGVAQGVNVAIPVSASSLQNTSFVSGSAIGSDLLWVRANDGQVWSDWKSWTVASSPHLTNAAPVVSAANNGLLRGETVAAADLFSASDADGDTITRYEFWDDVNGGGQWRVNGVQQAAGQTIAVAAGDLANTAYAGGANAGTEQVWARAYDGMAWSGWKNWLMSTEGGLTRGGSGPDTLAGDADTPILEGGAGDDTLSAGDSNSLLNGGSGDDALNGGDGNDLLIGGSGDDTIHTGGGSNVIAYNAGGGVDSVYLDAGSSNTLSMGGGLRYQDLSLAKDGNDLILDTGGGNQLQFKDWYAGSGDHGDVLTLQMIIDASADFDAGSSDPLANKRVQSFDFAGLVAAFDQARAGDPGITSWALTNALLQYHLAGADDAALGGDLAYQYGRNDALNGIGLTSALDVLASGNFGALAQQLRPLSGLQEGFTKLA